MGKKANWILTVALLIASAAFTVAIKVIDIQPVGANGTDVGFGTINMRFHEMTGVNELWYTITDILGYVALLICLSFAMVGLVQMIKRRSLLKVDRSIISLGGLYAVTIVLYVLFDKIALNYRPIIMPGEFEPEPSYPSSHTMLALVVFATAMVLWARALKKHPAFKVLIIVECVLLMVLTVGGRLYCGVHWLTDIVGGVLISATLVSGYFAFNNKRK